MATFGFIDLGAMGADVCKNLAEKSGCRVLACDLLREVAQRGATPIVKLRNMAAPAIVFLCLAGFHSIEGVAEAFQGLFLAFNGPETINNTFTFNADRTDAQTGWLDVIGIQLDLAQLITG